MNNSKYVLCLVCKEEIGNQSWVYLSSFENDNKEQQHVSSHGIHKSCWLIEAGEYYFDQMFSGPK
ncbi:MAG: hypothetical protein Q7R33_08675 [Nitrosarchaeum sp.]|nr:hypothetical protein [Nitrosarchaeum sp.]